MVLQFKYHSDSGVLQSYQDYTLAQGGNKTDVIAITSTASAPLSYKYCLEFVCYNSRNVPKAQYVSPILTYDAKDGLKFTVPSCLLEYAGHVDMQLVGYLNLDNTQVFKSVNKGCKAFTVEGSLNVLENQTYDTPNLLTELLDEVEGYRNERQDLEAFRGELVAFCNSLEVTLKNQVAESIDKITQGDDGVFYKVTFRINGEVIKSMCVKEGAVISPPEYTLPAGCEVRDGWYDMSKHKLWDFLNDHVSEDVTLTLNFASVGINVATNGRIKDFAGLSGDIYLPDYNNGALVTTIDTTVTNLGDNVNLHCGYNLTGYAGVLKSNDKVKQMYFPKDSKYVNLSSGVYSDKNQVGYVALIFAPRVTTATFNIPSDCQMLNTYAISNNTTIKKITIPPTVTTLSSYCIHNTGVTTLTIPASVTTIPSYSIWNNTSLTSVYLEGDLSASIGDTTFMDMTVMTSIKRPTLYVRPEHYSAYVARNLSYEIKVIGKDYLDEHYSAS